MSTTKKVILIVGSVLLVCLICAGIIIGANAGNMNGQGLFGIFNSASFSIDESSDLDLSGVDTINVECVSGDINITSGEPNATLTGSIITANPKENYLSVSKEGSSLTVKVNTNGIFPQTISTNVDLNISLPEDVLTNLNVSGASADTEINGLALKDVHIESASGDIHTTNCTGELLSIGVASGSIQVTDSGFNDVNADCISGDIDVQNATGTVSVGSTSGTVRVTNAEGDVSVGSTSGNVYVTQEQEMISAIHVNVISGDVQVKLNPHAAFDINSESTSGDFSTNFDVTVSGNVSDRVIGEDFSGKVNGGGALIDISTVSGDIRVGKID